MTKEQLVEIIQYLLMYKAAHLSDFCEILGLNYKGQSQEAMLLDLTNNLVEHQVKLREGKYVEQSTAEYGVVLEIFGESGYRRLNYDFINFATGACNVSLMLQSPFAQNDAFTGWIEDPKTLQYIELIFEHLNTYASQPLEFLIERKDLSKREQEDMFTHLYIALRLAEYIHPKVGCWLYLTMIRVYSDLELLCLISYVEKASLLESSLGNYGDVPHMDF